MTAYAELQITSNFSFLRGGSHPEELVLRAAELGLSAIALTDRNTLAGVVRAHIAAKEVGIRFVVGARLDLMPGDGADRSSAMKAAADSEDPSRSPTAVADSEVSLPGIPEFDPALGSEGDGDPCPAPSADVVPARSGKPQLDLMARQARSQANDVASDHGTASPAEPGDDEKAVPPPIWPADARHAAPAPSASNTCCAAATIPRLPSATSTDARQGRPVDDLLTSRRSGSAPHGMVGIRAPAAEQPRRSDSHHSPRHDLSVPGIGKQGVNVATGASDVARVSMRGESLASQREFQRSQRESLTSLRESLASQRESPRSLRKSPRSKSTRHRLRTSRQTSTRPRFPHGRARPGHPHGLPSAPRRIRP